ncbi:MAG: c-type cytochrome biogenesis protein CcsB [Nitrospirae bacterium]|nr:MAG: c-type cytochrome biogenesis protein CcsB [Nitrospirota bacterium]
MADILYRMTLVLYFFGTVLFLIYLLRRTETVSRTASFVTGTGFLAHTAALIGRIVGLGSFPLLTFQDAVSLFAWLLLLVMFGAILFKSLHVLGAFILPLAFLALVSAIVTPVEQPNLPPVFHAVWIHVTLSVLGTVGFAVAFVAGIMYLIQDRLLKSKRFNVLYFKLPPLDFLDMLNHRSILLGFPFLTLGILTGALSAQMTSGSYLSWNSEQIWALITWIFYFVVLLGRVTAGWRAKKAALLTIVGFAGVVLTFVGVLLKNPGSLSQ